MKRHVRTPHSKKIRELVRLQRKTKRTTQEDARHEHLYYWLTKRGEGPAFDARDIVVDSKRSYRALNKRALQIYLRRSRKWAPPPAPFAQAWGRTKREFHESLGTYFNHFDTETKPIQAEVAVVVSNEGASFEVTPAQVAAARRWSFTLRNP